MDGDVNAGAARPRLAVVYGHRSLELMQICDGARDWCDVVWLIDSADPSAARVRPILRKFGIVVDALGEAPNRAAEALRAYSPDGIATFYDAGMEHVAAIAAELGLPFHSTRAARGLEDKLVQREALRAAGLPSPRAAALPDGAGSEEVKRLGGSIGYPAVLKPRRASGSWRTFPVASPSALGQLWDDLEADERVGMMVEEYLADGPPMPHDFEADYVSVESIVQGGNMTHLALTGRFPVAPPFRETGFFIPATLGPGQRAEALQLAGDALRAIDLHTGSAHTEIKFTADGPRVIEVNGRIGGGVPDMLRLAAGVDLVKLAMRASLGLDVAIRELPATHGVAYRFFFQPPSSARRLVSLDGLEDLKRLPGVESVYLHHPPGSEIDARDGTRNYLFAVVGYAAGYDGMLAVEEFLRNEITAVYEDG
jgi:biotin carboxylase